jgi:hypothetical protein
MALLAELRTERQPLERRSRARRTLFLEIAAAGGPGAGRTVIRNLSETGLLLETAEPLTLGENIAVDLPEAGVVQANVVWTRAPFFGCEFTAPVSRAAVSASLLKSPIDEPPVELAGPTDTTWRLPEPMPISALSPPALETAAALMLFAAAVVAFVLALVTLQAG